MVEFCPNIVSFQAYDVGETAYTKLMHAVYNNQFKFLEQIPNPKDPCEIEPYNYAALALRDSLNRLVVCDQTRFHQTNNLNGINFKAHNSLIASIKEFRRLKTLIVSHYTNLCIMVMDSVVQDCPLLRRIEIKLFPLPHQSTNNSRNNYSSTKINQIAHCPDIKSFVGNWRIIHNDNSINYFIHKFTNLNKLYLRNDNSKFVSKDISVGLFFKFVEYISKITNVRVECAVKMDITDAWNSFMETANYQGTVRIEYYKYSNENLRLSRYSKHPSPASICDLTTIVSYSLDLVSGDILPQIRLIDRIGDKVQKVTVRNMNFVQGVVSAGEEKGYDMIYGYWLDDIFQKCWSLKVLKLVKPSYIKLDPNNSIHQNNSLERLEISHLQTRKNNSTIFTDLSARLPSLSHLKIYTNLNIYEWIQGEPIIVDVPFTSFDTLLWEKEQEPGDIVEKIHLKLTIIPGIKGRQRTIFFIGDSLDINKSSADIYESSLTKFEELSFDIRYKKIKYFWIKYEIDNKIDNLNIE